MFKFVQDIINLACLKNVDFIMKLHRNGKERKCVLAKHYVPLSIKLGSLLL